MKVLFIGNSHTYKHHMVFQFGEMMRQRKGDGACEVWSLTVGGKSLLWHGKEIGTQQALSFFEWDYVVLQQATHPFGGYPELVEGYEKLRPYLDKSGAEVLLYVTWKQKNAPGSDQEEINAAFEQLAREKSLRLIPAAAAWARCRAAHPEIELYEADESHAGPAGAYLTACTMFATFSGESPAGLPARLSRRGEILIDLEPGTAAALQQAAIEACGVKE